MDRNAPALAPSLYALIARKRHELIDLAKGAENSKAKADAEARIRFLIRLREDIEASLNPHPQQSVFISYSASTGKPYVDKIKPLAEELGFTVFTGFDRPEGENVLRTVRKLIEECSVYLGILTPEYTISPMALTSTIEPRTAPSVWIMEEKGMAIALDKPVRLLIESTVHADFWKRTTPEKLHNVFTPLTFDEHARVAMTALYRRYEEILLESLYNSVEYESSL